MDRLEAIRVFAEVARLNSFTSAARTLGQSLATVSRKVTLLETHLGVQLFTRTTRTVKLTDVGKTYLAGVQPLIESLEQIENDVADVDRAHRGNLAITTPGPFGRNHMVPLVAEFLEAHPEITIRHSFDNSRLDYVNAGIDIGLRIGRLRDSSLKLIKLGDVRVIVCASPDHIERHGRPDTPDELSNSRTVTYQPMGERVKWNFLSKEASEFSVEIDPIYRVDSIDAVVQFVVAGGGIGIFYSYQIAEHIAAGRLCRLLVDFEVETRPVSLLYPDAVHMPPRVRSFINFAVPQLKETLRQIENRLVFGQDGLPNAGSEAH